MPLLQIDEIAKIAGIPLTYIEPYGKFKAKIDTSIFDVLKDVPDGKLVLVTAITPTKAGEGKTTTSIALAEGMAKINQKAILSLREPSLGPVFGIKGGATGGGLASIDPRDDINLHFTGDMHALTSSINLIAAVIDNHLYQGNELRINPQRIVWRRAMDMNDRALRDIIIGRGEKNGIERQDGFVITVASELMAILCLAKDEEDFRERVQKIIVAFNVDEEPIRVRDLKISHAIMKLMKDALKPNLVQTIENNPVLIHGGPFANIAHGCNSLIALKLSRKLAPIAITEAGFGSDLGAEKFFDIACRYGEMKPDGVVMVATLRALKMHGGQLLEKISEENVEALLKGVNNLRVHLENIKKFGVPSVVAINHFASDHQSEIEALEKWCEEKGYVVSFLDGYLKGGEGAVDLAQKVVKMLDTEPSHYKPLYKLDLSIEEKIEKICKQIYRAGKVEYSKFAREQIAKFNQLGYGALPVCMAKTPLSLSDNPEVIGAPEGYTITIRELGLSAGAGFVVALTGNILTMPGLPKVPSAVLMEDLPY
ncbi:MAG TPA: formate--tetrahydrofolate ligase [Bacilli bacterium]|jgi:formate--tetrahydrofolate ligase|nr:formate--tetrahydrofolate ligase [Erysipelotrichaceae bacterium]HPM07262.1 formate--tetrahydrofolate ligase [Bacilli bacterium]